jgi:hypothetical protein
VGEVLLSLEDEKVVVCELVGAAVVVSYEQRASMVLEEEQRASVVAVVVVEEDGAAACPKIVEEGGVEVAEKWTVFHLLIYQVYLVVRLQSLLLYLQRLVAKETVQKAFLKTFFAFLHVVFHPVYLHFS